MGRLLKLFEDGTELRCRGQVYGNRATTADRFCIKIKFDGAADDGFQGYQMNLSPAEARRVSRKLNEFLAERDAAKPKDSL